MQLYRDLVYGVPINWCRELLICALPWTESTTIAARVRFLFSATEIPYVIIIACSLHWSPCIVDEDKYIYIGASFIRPEACMIIQSPSTRSFFVELALFDSVNGPVKIVDMLYTEQVSKTFGRNIIKMFVAKALDSYKNVGLYHNNWALYKKIVSVPLFFSMTANRIPTLPCT